MTTTHEPTIDARILELAKIALANAERFEKLVSEQVRKNGTQLLSKPEQKGKEQS